MIRGFYNGVSGIKTQSFGMDVWSNNISNINNVGFKASTPEFKSIFYQSMVSAGNKPTTDQVGLGAVKQTTALNMRDGSYQNTDNKFDLAIHGDGFFGIKDRYGKTYYTRAGAFDIDANGNLVDVVGRFVQGTMNPITQITPSQSALQTYGTKATTEQAYTIAQPEALKLKDNPIQENIKLPNFLYQPAKPTTKVDIAGNLDSSRITQNVDVALQDSSFEYEFDSTAKTISISGNVNQSDKVYNFKKDDVVVVKIEDTNGKFSEITANVDENGEWRIDTHRLSYMNLEDAKVSAKLLTRQEIANEQKMSVELFTSTFDKNLLTLNYTKQLPQGKDSTTWEVVATITDKEGKEIAKSTGNLVFGSDAKLVSQSISSVGGIGLNFKDTASDSIYKGLTSSNSNNHIDIKKDGYHEGVLKSYEVVDDAVIMAVFNNGQAFPIAKIALYHFQNDQGLSKMSENVYAKTSNSGEPFFYKDKFGDIISGAKIVSNKLEMSNVDLGTALTEIIVIQKAYDASSKSITTSDEMIQTAINMKR